MQVDYKDLFSFLTFLIAVVGFAMNIGKLSQRVNTLEQRALEDRADLKAIRSSVDRIDNLLAGTLATLQTQVKDLYSQMRHYHPDSHDG